MEPISNDENNYPKSLGHIPYNTAYKNNLQFTKNNLSKKIARTPLKSKLNLMNSTQNEKGLKYPLLKSISSSNINLKNKKEISYIINNNNDDIYDYEEEDEYNKNALPDEIEDFMHINENEINIKNDIDDIDMNKVTEYKKNDIKILDNVISPFHGNDNYVLGAHFDESDGDDKDINNFNSKRKFDEYFNDESNNDIDIDIDIDESNSN